MDDEFKLPVSSYDEIVKVIQGYGHYKKPVSLDQISQVSGINKYSISKNTGFLSAVNILEGGQKKALTSIGIKLATGLSIGMTDQIQTLWRDIIQGNEFLSKMISALSIKNGMDQTTFHGHILYSSGYRKNKSSITGANTIIELLKIAGFIEEKEGKLVCKEKIDMEDEIQTKNESVIDEQKPRISIPHNPNKYKSVFSPNIHIDIQIHISPETTLEQIDQIFASMSKYINNGEMSE